MDAAPPIALRLFQFANLLASQSKFRPSALTFAAAARVSGLSLRLQAFALYEAAAHLFESTKLHKDKQLHSGDIRRALDFIQKCLMVTRSLPSFLEMNMQCYALQERIHSHNEDHLTAAKIINNALAATGGTRSHTDRSNLIRWWIYFRGRAITNAIATGSSHQMAVSIATESADHCTRSNHHLSAAAFHLANVQIALATPTTIPKPLHVPLNNAIAALSAAPPPNNNDDEDMDLLLLHTCCIILQALYMLRSADIIRLKDEVLPNLSRAYNNFRGLRKRRIMKFWQWVPHPVMSALVYFIMTVIFRATNDVDHGNVHAMTALSRLGIRDDALSAVSLDYLVNSGISKRAARSVCVAVIENAARLRLTELNLSKAAGLIAAAVQICFPGRAAQLKIALAESGQIAEGEMLTVLRNGIVGIGLAPRCTTYLLIAEFHVLRGRLAGARVATEFLQALRQLAGENVGNLDRGWFSDTWHMAVSHLSLLTGEKRSELADVSGTIVTVEDQQGFEKTFVSPQVFAFALFSKGVYSMRAAEVLESRKVLTRCLETVRQLPACKEQIEANANSVLSGLAMTHEKITSEAAVLIDLSVRQAQLLRDPVTLVRAGRQAKKLRSRTPMTNEERAEAEALVAKTLDEMNRRQQDISPISSLFEMSRRSPKDTAT